MMNVVKDQKERLTCCQLCPRNCKINRIEGQTGFCGAGPIVTVSRAAPHFWEEPCISGGRGSGTVFFNHCTLGCSYCQNAKISRRATGGIPLSDEKLAGVFIKLQGMGVHNINLVTPTHYALNIIEAVKMARGEGLALPVVYNCGGYETEETIDLLGETVDVWLPDYKYADSRPAALFSNAPDYPEVAAKAIAHMLRQAGPPQFDAEGMLTKGVLVRHLMLPGQLIDSVKAIERLWNLFGNDIVLSLMSQYTPAENDGGNVLLNHRINPRHYDVLIGCADDLGFEYCYMQDFDSAGEEFIPSFEGEGI